MRHRASVQDLGLLVAALLVTAYVLLEVDVFVTGESGAVARTIELDELPIIGIVLCLGLLLFSWRRSRAQKRETARRLAAERHARTLAMQDPLTALPNRRQFVDALKAAVAAPPRAGGAHALLMLDLNGFKQINDVYGHGAGDQVLIEVGDRLLAAVRHGDFVARLGGDEFVVLARHIAGPEAATSIALRIIEMLAAPLDIGNIVSSIGTGIGVCLFPFEGSSEEEVMRRADVALYKAKAERKSAMRYFDDQMDQQVREREYLERELRGAVTRGEIRPFFQPLVDLKSKEITGFETLARWFHPTLGEVPPERFIPIAEDMGLIQQLGDQLLRAACRTARSWPSGVTLAFNISPVQLRDQSFGLRVLTILGEAGLSPGRLELEITESALVSDLEAAQNVLGSLRNAGVRIALDDFGTGYSSLYHLRNFKLDKIKIDRSFVLNMSRERESAEIVSALIGLGHGLGLTVTAEGIEQGSQESDLVAQGCQQGQGYLFGRAMPAGETVDLFARAAPDRAAVG